MVQVYEGEHELDCTPAEYYALSFDETFTEALFRDCLGFDVPQPIALERSAERMHRKVSVNPRLELPRALAKAAEGRVDYVEEQVWDSASDTMRLEYWPSILKGRLRIQGEVKASPLAEGRCLRRSRLEVETKVAVIGGAVERAILKNIAPGWDRSAPFINRWLAEHR